MLIVALTGKGPSEVTVSTLGSQRFYVPAEVLGSETPD